MLLFRKPTPEKIQRFLAEQAEHPLSYDDVGVTQGVSSSGYVRDHSRVLLGSGMAVFSAAQAALQDWQQFRVGWVEAQPADTPIETGQLIAVVARSMGLWWLNACRIVSVLEEQGSQPKFGFAYGTLPDHIGAGEERFLVEMDEHQQVWYDILAFSRPQHPLVRLGYPWMRIMQKRFGRDSTARMQRLVCDSESQAGR
ncbi:DUF1990 family protein [Roseimaritima ulvae]|uniref:DUF1990 domain-containing protein n=1 Tax=Roseimaritima ulvae TaxID=980254 RepID=A0A5B9QH02_9BACT|nr:DUF1990 domain-containing protein [Roseimaritima ulvae]QEG38084.1 hypothetical protein UC8_00370 [Roseimaritima ulvae]